VIATDHTAYDYNSIVDSSKLVVAANATRRVMRNRERSFSANFVFRESSGTIPPFPLTPNAARRTEAQLEEARASRGIMREYNVKRASFISAPLSNTRISSRCSIAASGNDYFGKCR